MAVTSRRTRSVVLLLAMAVVSRANGAGDLCMDDPEDDHFMAIHGGVSFPGFRYGVCVYQAWLGDNVCDAVKDNDTCAFSCGKCDTYYPMPECTSDEIAANKERLCKFLLATKIVSKCVVNVTALDLEQQKNGESSDADPCTGWSESAKKKGLEILCDRCGEVRSIEYQPKRPAAGMDGHIPDEFFTFKKLKHFWWWNNAKDFPVPSFRFPQNHSLLEFPVLTQWQSMGIKLSLNQLSSTSLVWLAVMDIWEGGRLEDVQFPSKLVFLQIYSYIGDSVNNYKFARQARNAGHNEEYNNSTPIVGNMPESICNPHLGRLYLRLPGVSGPVPSCLADSIELDYVRIFMNLSGDLAPLLASPKLERFEVWGAQCNGSQLPDSLSSKTRLTRLIIPGCGLSGELPDITSRVLSELDLSNNLLQGAGTLSGKNAYVNLAGNLIEKWPPSWNNLTGVARLNLSDNPLAEWPLAGVPPQVYQMPSFCGVDHGGIFWEPHFHWPAIESLTLNNCPLNLSVRDFLYSLTYTGIKAIEADNCSLHGGIDPDFTYFVPDRSASTGDDKCAYDYGFKSLVSLSLGNNKVEYFGGEPWGALSSIDLSNNLLEFLPPSWFSGDVYFLELQGNPGFRAAVSPPPADGECPKGRRGGLVADPTMFNAEALHRSDVECTSLCTSSYFPFVDATASESLCRPRCQIGWYREDKTSPSCTQCPQWPIQTTAHTGSISIGSCMCSSEYAGLRAIASQCGCDDGLFLNHMTKTCEKCSYAEMCSWGVDVGDSLLPPRTRPGYWVDPASQSENFSGNDIWLCKSKITCEMNGKCATGRGGIACSLCLPGKFGGPDGECRDCPGSQEYHWLFGILAIVGTSPLVIALHGVLVSRSASRSVLITLRALRRSFRQLLRQIQAVAIVSGYSVKWPPLAKAFFEEMARFSLALPSWAGAACFGREQSATIEMVFRWSMPVALALSILCAVPLSKGIVVLFQRFLPRLLLKVHSTPEQLQMTLWDGTRVFVFSCVIFYATLLEYSFMLFMCPISPNGSNMVADFPHLKCSFREPEYLALSVTSIIFIVFNLGGLAGSIIYAFFRQVRESAQSGFAEHGWWGFLFEDFRSTRPYWLLILMGRDMCLVMVRMVSAGNGLAQLFTASVLSCIIGVSVMVDSPYVDYSNTVMEGWNHAAVALICLYTAGMGYESTPGIAESSELYDGGDGNATYRTRAIGMFVAQLLAFFVPCMIMLYQLLLLKPHIRRRLPRTIRPHTVEENKAWSSHFVDSLNLESNNDGAGLVSLLEKFDNVEFEQFRTIVSSSLATATIDGLDESSPLSPRSYVRRKASSCRSTPASEDPHCAQSSGEVAPPQHSGSEDVKPEIIGRSDETGSSHQREPSDQHALIPVQDGGEAAKRNNLVCL